ncbi:MAG: 2-hydroxy-3-oxopropionate reductase [Sphaerochaetaceae bacterium]
MKIAFIGLGVMGKPMVRNLLKHGNEVWVYDLKKENIDAVTKDGAKAGTSNADIVGKCPLIITMLPNSPQVEAVVLGKDGLLEHVRPGSVLIDMSSIAPAASQKVSAECAKKGVKMLDAPVSGGEPKAVDGTLAIMVGGERTLYDAYKDLLLQMGASAVYCGPIGAGNTTKLANQIIVAVNIAACAEAFTMVKKAGLDPDLVFQAIKGGLAGSTVMNAKVPMMVASDFKPGFRIDLHIKDLNNALQTGHEVGSPLPLTAEVQEMFETLHADGFGTDDHSALAKYYAKVSGTKIGK